MVPSDNRTNQLHHKPKNVHFLQQKQKGINFGVTTVTAAVCCVLRPRTHARRYVSEHNKGARRHARAGQRP